MCDRYQTIDYWVGDAKGWLCLRYQTDDYWAGDADRWLRLRYHPVTFTSYIKLRSGEVGVRK